LETLENTAIQNSPVRQADVQADSAIALPPKREAFAQHYAAYGNATAAYRAAFDASHMKVRSVREMGYQTAHEPAVRARVRELLAQAAEGATISARARMMRLQLITEADPGELVSVVAEACRWCNGKGHAYQWVDFEEYLAALSVATAKNEERTAKGQRPRPLPSDDGGYGYDPQAEPHEDCPRCKGEGMQRVRVTPTDKLSPSARALLKGIRQKPDGTIEVHMHDAVAASDQLNRMQGVYVDKSISLNISTHVEPLPDMTPQQIADMIQQQKQIR
jgi:phage terminase small subunit